ncbi:MAG: IPT/TIG domain-containing protein [Elusimicrobiales bacterium]|nr:IPT/TIG domain-containing protein [Elusimicrobiales bacterium]
MAVSAKAWNSKPIPPYSSTHWQISNDAIQSLSPLAYPDVTKFIAQLSDGANTESHTTGLYTSQLDNSLNGGKVKTWWDEGLDNPLARNPDNAVYHYKTLNLSGAYSYIGQMLHLIQDQGVPAHAANIRHGYVEFSRIKLDNMELTTGIHYTYSNVPAADTALPYFAYQDLQTNTRGQLSYWIDPITSRQYWNQNMNAPGLDADATFGPFGFYGGDSAQDLYDYGVQPAPAILNRQTGKTLAHTQGALTTASKLLPPIVYGMDILGEPAGIPVISEKYYTPIEFTITENRVGDLGGVKVVVEGLGSIVTKEPAVLSISATESQSGSSEYSELTGNITWDAVPVSLFATSDTNLTVLPFKAKIRLSWKADELFANVPDGDYRICAGAKDADGNFSPKRMDSCHQFKLDRRPPVLSLGNLFMEWEGISTNIVPTLKTSQHLTITDAGAGVKTVLVTGPSGILVDETYGTPLTDSQFEYNFEDLQEGLYTITTTDALGHETMVQFAVGVFSAAVNLDKSNSVYSVASDTFNVNVAVDLSATFGLKKLEFISPSSTETVTEFEGTSVTKTFDLAQLFKGYNFAPPVGVDHNVSYDYSVRAWDGAGNYITKGYHAGYAFIWDASLLLGGNAVRETGLLDLRSYGLLNGSIFPVGDNGTAVNSRLFPLMAESSLDLTPRAGAYEAHSYLGKVEVFVKTSDLPDLSDAEYVLAATRHLTGTQEPPDEYTGSASYQVSFQDYPTANVTLKRYYQVKSVATPDFSDSNLHLCVKFSTTTPGHCEYGYSGAPIPTAYFEIWGISIQDGGHSDSSGNRVYVSEGQNVGVSLGGFLNVLFENVTNGGYLSYSLGYAAPLPGQTSLMSNTAIKFMADSSLSFSGDVRITVPYSNASLSQEQESGIQGYRILPEGGADWVATSVDTVNKTATAMAQTLGSFAMTAPAYAATHSYDYPDMAFRSGESDVAVRQVEQDSPEWLGIASALGAKQKNIASNIYYFGPEDKSFPVAASIGFYTDGSNADSADIYEFNGDQSSFIKLPKTRMNFPGGSIYMANVTQFHSYFALLESSESVTVDLLPDSSAPVTGLSFSMPYYEKAGRRIVSSSAKVYLNAFDPEIEGHITSGVATTYYVVDADTSTAEPSVYGNGFSLLEGTHTVYYASQDEAENLEEIKYLEFDMDGTPPVTSFVVAGSSSVQGGMVYAGAESTFSLVSVDPLSAGISAGPMAVFYLVDVSTQECANIPVDNSGPEGTCQNPYYTKSFSLSPGEHTVYFAAIDNAGNEEALKTVLLNVSSAPAMTLPITPSSGPIGIPFTIEGAGFGTYSVGTTVVLLGDTTAPLTLWNDTRIQGTIPGTLATGQYPVYVKRGGEVLAEVSPFTVAQPVLYSLTPSSGAIGLPFTITGESFGNYVAGYTRVLLGGATMPLTLWTDAKIQGTIPGTLPVGDYEVVVERALNGGLVQSSSTTFSLRNMEAYWLAPSSGPIGMPFTITGVGFGNYSSVYTHVLIGDTTTPLTLWTDTKIQGTIPGSLASGQYPVLVERRTSDGGIMQTPPMSFEVVNVDVASMTPVAGPIGLPFTIYGNNFGNYVANYTRVLIGGTTCPLTLWTADKIQGAIPGALGPGEYPVVVERELNGGIVQSSALALTVSTPTAYEITPASGSIGVPFTINGENFGNYSAAYTGVLINGATVPLTLWTDTQIKGTIPGNLTPGQYPVVVGRMTADGGAVQTEALGFEVVGVNVTSMTPVAGPIGMPFIIYGANFGNYAAGFTKVLIGGATAPLTLWSDTQIKGTIPGSLAAGEYPLVVERNLNGGQVQSQPLAFNVTTPMAYTLNPSSGPIGLPFVITGENFGNYVANYTKVLIGGAAAPLTLWTDTQIKGTIPGALPPGEYGLYVERALNGGVVQSSTFTFTVGAPYLATVSPSTAAVIAPFTVTGYNFGDYVANYTKVLVNGATTQLTLWTDTKIQGKLPYLLAGTYPVQVQRYLNGGLAESATAYIAIEEPVLSSMTPVSGAGGTVFNLYGTGFGAYDASIAHITIGGVACALSLWSDARITGTVPSELTAGTHTVVASRGQALSNALEFYITGGYTPSMMRPDLTPSALEFKLGEVYVYPDPAKGGKVPVFHIEVGTADTVKLKVYTVAGQLAHERTITGSPQAVGSVYAYEYPWTGHIASGVYYYTIEAERAGKKLKTKGKFSVVR